VILVIVLLLTTFFQSSEVQSNVTAPPSFSLKEITDESFDWLDFWRGKQYGEGPTSIDIRSVNYFSNGKFLNATIWFPKPTLSNLSLAIPQNDSTIDYGMYIDADFDNKTGVEGIDYMIEIQWDNSTKKWNRVVEEWATNTNAKVLSKEQNYTDISENEGYVSIYADLNMLTSPVRYKVIFYAQEIKGKTWTIDHTEWLYIPPPKFTISTLPGSVDVRAGENSTVEVSVKSDEGFEPAVLLYSANQSEGVKLDFKYDRLKIPSYGVASTPLVISTHQNASQQPYTATIFANFTFPNEKFITPLLQVKSQSIEEQASLTVKIDEPVTIIDQISDFWQKLGSPINFVYVIAAALAPFVYALVKRSLEKHRIKSKGEQLRGQLKDENHSRS
jgi:hypothetical protein